MIETNCVSKYYILINLAYIANFEMYLYICKWLKVLSPRKVFPFAFIFSKRHRFKYNSEKLYCFHQDSNPGPLETSALLNAIKGVPTSRVTIKWLFRTNTCDTSITKLTENCIPCTQRRLGNYLEKCPCPSICHTLYSKLWKMMYS